jgi:hypothetical protein
LTADFTLRPERLWFEFTNPPALTVDRTFRPDLATTDFIFVSFVCVVVSTFLEIAAHVPHVERRGNTA